MEPLANLLPSAHAALPSRESAATAPPLGATAARTLWVRMAEIYGHRWSSAYGEDSSLDGAAGTWAKGLAGVTPAQVAAGLNACIASSDPWPPTLPEFRAKCLGIPTLAAVRLNPEAQTPFNRLVWQHLDGYRFRNASADAADRMLRDAYEQAREHVMLGGALPAPVAGEIEQERREIKPAAPEVAEAAMQRIRESLGVDDDEQDRPADMKSAAAGRD